MRLDTHDRRPCSNTYVEGTDIARSSFPALAVVFQQAERRAATDRSFIFLGHIFDRVKQPVYIDGWMHLAPAGNELVAESIAKTIEASLGQQQSVRAAERPE